jgi:thymidine phosphorylase
VAHAGQLLEQIARGERVGAADVAGLVRDWDSGTASEAQMGAWCMAAHVGRLDHDAVRGVVRGLVAAGDRLELGAIGPSGAAYSLGAVGDPSSLIAAPIAASLGARVPYLCSRGVDEVGGDRDRLEAVPGYRTTLGLSEFVAELRSSGVAVAGEVERLVPARARLGVLSQSVGLASSTAIALAATLAAAIASGAQGIVLVVPVGRGGFATRSDVGDVGALAADIAEEWRRELRSMCVAVEAPLGPVVGNGLEIAHAGAVLRGDAEGPIRELALTLAGAIAETAGVLENGSGREEAERALVDGHALAAAEVWIDAHGGDPAVWTEPGLIPHAPLVEEIVAPWPGALSDVDPRALGAAARWVGAGRMHPSQAIDVSVGVELEARPGDRLERGQVVARVHGRDPGLAEGAAMMLERGIRIDGRPLEEGRDA